MTMKKLPLYVNLQEQVDAEQYRNETILHINVVNMDLMFETET